MIQEELISKLNAKDLFDNKLLDNLTPGTFLLYKQFISIFLIMSLTLRVILEQLILPRGIFFLHP